MGADMETSPPFEEERRELLDALGRRLTRARLAQNPNELEGGGVEPI